MTLLYKIFSILLILNGSNLWGQDLENEVESERAKIKETYESIEKQVEDLKEFEKVLPLREQKIYDFRIKFSGIITNFATDSSSFHIQFQKNKKILEDLELEVNSWIEEVKLKKDKVSDLQVILQQSNDSFRDKLKQLDGKDKKFFYTFINKDKKLIKTLKKQEDVLSKHLDFLNSFTEDKAKWKGFLVNKIKKGLDENLFTWQISDIFVNPVGSFKVFIKDMQSINETTQKHVLDQFRKKNKKNIILRILIFLVFAGLITFISRKLKKWYTSVTEESLDHNLFTFIKILLSNIPVIITLGLSIIVIKDLGKLSYTYYPQYLGFGLFTFLFCLFWYRIGYPIIDLLIAEVNRSDPGLNFVFRRFPVVIFVVTRLAQSLFSMQSGFLYFFNSVFLAWISYKFFLLCNRLRIEKTENDTENLLVFLQSTKIFIAVFALGLFGSSLIEIIGYANLGRSVQVVVFNNILSLGLGWLIYQSLSYIINTQYSLVLDKTNMKNGDNLLPLIKKLLNVSFIVVIILLVVKSWHSTIFLFADFWNITIFKFGDYRFTIDKPVKLIYCYFLVKIAYVCVISTLDTFILKRLKISSKYASNVASIIRYLFIIIFLSITSAILGVTYKNLVIFASALGVGIGFGLQNIVNNFISGIILLFEQPIRVGDIIEVNGLFSKVKHIGIRSTIVESLDNSSIIIPNSEILSNKLINWTLNNNIIAIKCEVGVAYGTDTKLVESILDEVAVENLHVLKFPHHQVWFNEFADSSLNFVLKVWINKPEEKYIIHSALMHRINQKIADAGVTIPFPQRDIHIKENNFKVKSD